MSGRVSLSSYRPDDAVNLAAALADPETARWLSALPWPYGLDEAQAFIARVGADEVAIRVDGDFAGGVRGGNDLGIWVHPRFRGQGVATRAATLALGRSFAAGRDVVYSSHLRGNHGSAALLARLGFVADSTGIAYVHALQREVPNVQLRLARADFEARNPVTITTARLLLDQAQPQDLPALYDIATHPEVARMLLRFYPDMPMAEFRETISAQAALPPFRLAIRQGGQVIGSIGIGALGKAPPIFYFLSTDHWGQGLGGEVLSAFLAEIDARFALPRLSAEVFADNPASARLLERYGFQETGQEMLPTKGRDAPAAGLVMHRDLPEPD